MKWKGELSDLRIMPEAVVWGENTHGQATQEVCPMSVCIVNHMLTLSFTFPVPFRAEPK